MTDEEIKQARAIIDAANQVRPKSDRIEIAGFEVDENDEIVATSNLFVDVALSEWPRALDALENMSSQLEFLKANYNDHVAALEQERDQLKARVAELESEVERLKERIGELHRRSSVDAADLIGYSFEASHQRKRAEAWREAALCGTETGRADATDRARALEDSGQ